MSPEDTLDAWVAALVDQAPLVSDETRVRIAALLSPLPVQAAASPAAA